MTSSKVRGVLRSAGNFLISPLVLQVTGGMVGIFLAELVRRGSNHVIESVGDALRITAIISDTDPSFDWLTFFIRHNLGSSSIPSPSSPFPSEEVAIYKEVLELLNPKGRIPPNHMRLLTQKPLNSPDYMHDDEEDDLPNDPRRANSEVPIYRLPRDPLDVVVRFGREDIRFRTGGGKDGGGKVLEISVISTNRSRDLFLPLIYHSRTLYLQHTQSSLKINIGEASPSWWGWRRSYKPLRSWESIFLPDDIKDKVLRDTREFLDGKSFYRKRGLPWRRGWLLFGLPGTGKTSMITALASHFNLQVYIVNLGAKGIDDDHLLKLVSSVPPKSILLFEDIDCAFQATRNTSFVQEERIIPIDGRQDPESEAKEMPQPLSKNDDPAIQPPIQENDPPVFEQVTSPDSVHQTPRLADTPSTCSSPRIAMLDETDTPSESGPVPQTIPTSPSMPRAHTHTHTDITTEVHYATNDIPLPPRYIRGFDDFSSPTSLITLSGLLNAIDGLAASEGRILFCTTNWKERIDPALYRPGRCDVWLEFTYATPQQAFDLFRFFYLPDEVQPISSPSGLNENTDDGDIERLLDMSLEEKIGGGGITNEDVDQLAKEFSELIPKDRLTISALQSYLMHFKNHPQRAIEYLPRWSEGGCKYTFIEE